MLTSKRDRGLLLRLGLRPEELARLADWTEFTEPRPDITEMIVRLAMEEFKVRNERPEVPAPGGAVSGAPAGAVAATDDSVIEETAFLQRSVLRKIEIAAGVAVVSVFAGRSRFLRFVRKRAVLLVSGITIVSLALLTVAFRPWFNQPEQPQPLAKVAPKPEASATAEVASRASQEASYRPVGRQPSGALAFALDKIAEIPISSKPEGATVVTGGAEAIHLGKTPMTLEVYDTPEHRAYVSVLSGGKQRALLVPSGEHTLRLEFQIAKQKAVSRTVDLRKEGAMRVDLYRPESPEQP